MYVVQHKVQRIPTHCLMWWNVFMVHCYHFHSLPSETRSRLQRPSPPPPCIFSLSSSSFFVSVIGASPSSPACPFCFDSWFKVRCLVWFSVSKSSVPVRLKGCDAVTQTALAVSFESVRWWVWVSCQQAEGPSADQCEPVELEGPEQRSPQITLPRGHQRHLVHWDGCIPATEDGGCCC